MNENQFPFKMLSSLEVSANASTIKFKEEKYKKYMFEYVVDGAGFVEHNGRKYHCKKDSIYMFQPGRDYIYYHDPDCPWRKIFVIFTGELADTFTRIYNLTGKVYFPDRSKCLPFFKELLHLRCNADETASVIIHHIFNLLQQRETETEYIPPAIHTLKTYLEGYLHKKFVLNDFAATENVSSAYLISQFKKHYHCTPYAYLVRLRLDAAENMLKYTHMSIKEIAAALNFNDQYHFSNLFKQKFGISPLAYRRTQA